MEQNKVKFSKNNNEFIIELRDKVKDYFIENNISKYGNTGLVIKAMLMVVVYLAPYVLMLTGTFESLIGILIGWLVMGFGMAGMGMVLMHDANHGSFSQNRKINKWLSKSAYLLGAYPLNWQFQHNTLHHGYTNIDGHDEDIAPVGVLRFSPHTRLHKFHKYQYLYAWFFYCLMTFSWVTMKDFTRLFRYRKLNILLNDPKRFRKSLAELIMSKMVFYILFLFLPLLVVPISWYWIVMGLLLMLFVSGLILSTIFQTAHVIPDSAYPLPDENGSMKNNWAIHQLLTTSDFSPKSRIFSWLIGGLNYQIEHHLFPNISHVHYRSIAHLVKVTAEKNKLPYNVQGNFFKAVNKHVQMLKILGAQPFTKTLSSEAPEIRDEQELTTRTGS